jgi:hypothetical protein
MTCRASHFIVDLIAIELVLGNKESSHEQRWSYRTGTSHQ